jgi:multidrug transporter EmrE-like cation transporter
MSFFDWLKPLFLFAFYVGVSCSGLFLLKAAPSWLSLRFGLGFLLYALGACLWLVILRNYPLSLAFPIAAGALIVGTTLVGIVFLGESLSAVQVAGAGLIFLGIALLASRPGLG